MTDQTSSGRRPPPLAGVRVLDFTRVLAGPWSTLNLADLGAEVIKVENPKGGDDTRQYKPPEVGGEASYFLFVNRNKKSLALDITKPEGQAIVRRLAAQVDVVIENYRPDVMERQGIDYASLSKVNPRLIYCSISGYGHDSPLKMVAGYDPVAQAESGMMSITGEPDGEPMRSGASYADIFTGMFATQAIMGALFARERDGLGQHIDLALVDSAVAVTANLAQNYLVTGQQPQRLGNRHPFLEPFGTFQCADGLINIVIGNARQWERFCKDVLDRPDLLEDPRFATNPGRLQNRQAVRDLLTVTFLTDTRENWIARMRAAGVPAGSVRAVGEALEAPEIRYRGMVREVEHPTAGTISMLASPLKLSGTPTADLQAPPLLGQHTDEVLSAAGYDAGEIAALRETGIVG
ncbi:crotonobetainyl-CoA:carnitine CoA-transferase CaiB-like acyl-CoA transferase [Constrictibacter sp. MBR-5]|jgi:crotonobetainyl-CoA:carnitine CoA-transferase CaiB-like acyl-CoA transferase|uniref:CaiB/BaiF CoA transferase family protein n=1 Tax=Constrictibacter sp. MBR-5 TaxID=3156467 RepID=UPI003394DD23